MDMVALTEAVDRCNCRIIGGTAFPGILGTVSVSWPLTAVVVSDAGVHIDVRFRWIRRLLAPLLDQHSRGVMSFWEAAWSDITAVEVGRRSIVFRVRDRRGCRFVVWRRKKLSPLLSNLELHRIPIRYIKTTLGWYFK